MDHNIYYNGGRHPTGNQQNQPPNEIYETTMPPLSDDYGQFQTSNSTPNLGSNVTAHRIVNHRASTTDYENAMPPLSDDYAQIQTSVSTPNLGSNIPGNRIVSHRPSTTGFLYDMYNPGPQHFYHPGLRPSTAENTTAPRFHQTDPSVASDNVFMSNTDSSNPVSPSSSGSDFVGLSSDARFTTPSYTFLTSTGNGVSADSVYHHGTAPLFYLDSAGTGHNSLLTNGTFGYTAMDSILPPPLHCPIMMLKTPEIQPRSNPSTNIESPTQHSVVNPNVSTSNRQQNFPGQSGNTQTSPSHQMNTQSYQHPEANIRQVEKSKLKSLLLSGNLVQVSGPPMAGKSTLVRQAVNEKKMELQGAIMQHHLNCKKLYSLENLMSTIVEKLCQQSVPSCQLDEEMTISRMHSQLCKHNNYQHVLVFHKCESFMLQHNGHQFSDFLSRMVIEFKRLSLNATVIFTTYKKFSPKGFGMETLEIDTLSDFWDVISILNFYAPHMEVLNYAHICVKHLCLPEAIRLVAETFIASEDFRVPAEELEKKIFNDEDFLSSVFDCRLNEVPEWIPQNILMSIIHFSHSLDSSFTLEHLQKVSADKNPYEWQKIIQYLKNNYIIRCLPGVNRMAVHPLVVNYCKNSVSDGRMVLSGHWFDNSCNRYTNFLCRILVNTEANMRMQGRKGLVYGGLIQEWPNVRYLIHRALHCNENTYEAFLKVSISANGLIMRCFAKEAKEFYRSLFTSASSYGTPVERAVLEALFGNALSMASVPANPDDETLCCMEYNQADQHLTSAISKLYREGPSYFLVWALDRKGIVLHRLGKYQESIKCFGQARTLLSRLNKHALGEMFHVSDLQVEEERITQEIHQTIPIIFTGNNQLARERLNKLLEHINNRCENHPELSTLLNLIGLTEQRGNNDLDSAIKWYRLSYNERMYLSKVNPENLLVVLNNIAMILLEKGELEQCIKYLTQALDIRRECGWRHYHTALTLTHLSEVYMKCDNFPAAYKKALEADKILKVTAKEHDMRLRVNFTLAHIRVVLRQRMEPESAREDALTESHLCLCHENLNFPNMGFQEQSENVPDFGALMTDCMDYNRPAPAVRPVSGNAPGYHQQGCPQACPTQHNIRREGTPIFPTLSMSTVEIEPRDLNMTAVDFLDYGITLSHDGGTLSDDGHKNFLASHTHAMLLSWGDTEKLTEHKTAIVQYVKDNPTIETAVFNSPVALHSRYEFLRNQAPLYYYIRDTPIEGLNLSLFLNMMVKSCYVCAYVKNIFTEEMWMREARHLVFARRERERFLQEMDQMRLGPFFSDTSYHEVNSNFTGAADVSFLSHTATNRNNKVADGSPCNAVIEPNFPEIQLSSHTLLDLMYPESVRSDIDNYETYQSAENNLSQPVESPKIIQEQKNLLEKFARPGQKSQDSLMGAIGGLNIPHSNIDLNLETNDSRQKKEPLRTKFISNYREPVEQSENESVIFKNDHFENQNKHLLDQHRQYLDQHRQHLDHTGQSVGLQGHSDNQQRHFVDQSRHSMLKNSVYSESFNKISSPMSHQSSSLQMTYSRSKPQNIMPSPPAEPHPTSLSQYLKTAWPSDTKSNKCETGSENLSKGNSLSKTTFLDQYIKDMLDPSFSHQSEMGPPTPFSHSNDHFSITNSNKCSLPNAVKSGTDVSTLLYEYGKTSTFDSQDGQRSMTESGFSGSAFGMSDDDLHQNALCGNSHNSCSTSPITHESGYSSQGAKPKTNSKLYAGPKKQDCPLISPPKRQWSSDTISSRLHREPLEDSENISLDARDFDEESWCDTIITGQCSGDNFITVLPAQPCLSSQLNQPDRSLSAKDLFGGEGKHSSESSSSDK
ncbi:uncharacterized protein LOC106052525 isoform X1 [Biomphalaria glabrata]|uniref:Uncharacterized protein LOC106052525 isoform X1 n=1 Tax=Biomphalaria glabrata TaxID=6526 RepID=A0A9W3BDF8_BIOGL|nr:uncharacterized protein LOC106052525 isoform X1 [Biomphalaria glabrata]XP_055897463.1 uncharacterized protein LOC106052525 isoform X1 [Biomphalaria glabrata]